MYFIFELLEEPVNGKVLSRGEEVDVVGPSSKRGHLIVKNNNIVMDVPYHLLDLKVRGLNYWKLCRRGFFLRGGPCILISRGFFAILLNTFQIRVVIFHFYFLFLQTIPELPAMDIWQSSLGKKCNFTTSVENHIIAISDFFNNFWSGTATV